MISQINHTNISINGINETVATPEFFVVFLCLGVFCLVWGTWDYIRTRQAIQAIFTALPVTSGHTVTVSVVTV